MTLEKAIDVEEGLKEFIKLCESKPNEQDLENYYSRWKKKRGERYVAELRRTNELYVGSLKELKRRGYDGGSGHDVLPAR